MNKPLLHSYYWLESAVVKNLGDYLTAIILDALGYRCVNRNYAHPHVVNPGRCLLSVGSIPWNRTFDRMSEPVDVWGAGWRGTPLSPSARARAQFHAVRGPRTAQGLGLSKNIPLGDPALLLPTLKADAVAHHGRTLVIPHFHRSDQIPAKQRCVLTGCDALLAMRVIGAPVRGRRISPRRLHGMVYAWMRQGIPIHTPWQVIHRIAGAGFVLTGSLHGAILAQAYGVPWAAYDDGCVDVPEKWHDWADYLRMRIAFVPNLRAGMDWWYTEGQHGEIRDIAPLLAAFPYRKTEELFFDT
ncbi:MAG TPA: hypothetical protein DCS43_09885 [Verrucomicrobia bacterium]|nr:hypothetical protein [Verrucomicrobiota bacterium]